MKIVIPENIVIESEKLVKDIDFDDILFVALTKYIEGKLWTGDNRLIEGLKLKGFTQIITTKEVLILIDKYEIKNK